MKMMSTDDDRDGFHTQNNISDWYSEPFWQRISPENGQLPEIILKKWIKYRARTCIHRRFTSLKSILGSSDKT